jgi:hypothetical protein
MKAGLLVAGLILAIATIALAKDTPTPGVRPHLGTAARCAQSRAHEMLRLDRQ